jgi:hypothetical protein
VVEFGEWVCGEVLKKVPHRHFVFSIPKILRCYFLYDRSLLSELSRCAWEALRVFFREVVPQRGGVPGSVIEKIVKHLGLWDVKAGPRPKGRCPPHRLPSMTQIPRFHSLPFPSTRISRWIPMGADGAVDRMGKMS